MERHQLIMKSILWSIYALRLETELFLTADHEIKLNEEIEIIELDLMGEKETGRKLLTRVEKIDRNVLIDEDLIIDKLSISTICVIQPDKDRPKVDLSQLKPSQRSKAPA